MKKWVAIVLAISMALSVVSVASASDENAEEQLPQLHYYEAGRPLVSIPDELWKIDARGGRKIDLPSYNFSSPDAKFDISGLGFIWTNLPGGGGCYKLTIADETVSKYAKSERFEVKPNREYLCSFLINSNFTRFTEFNARTRECGVNVYFLDKDGNILVESSRGFPDNTQGWTRIEFVSSPGVMEAVTSAELSVYTGGFLGGMPDSEVYIADFQVFELPEKELVPYAEGEGMTFRGTAGDLDMKVQGADVSDNAIVVNTTGVRYTFDKANSVLTAEQKVGTERKVSTWQSSVSFEGLRVRSTTDTECVLSNPNISFGVQMDGSVFLTPHKENVRLVCTSEIAGSFNRLHGGVLLVLDDYGGFTVMPDVPVGTGLTSQHEVLTPGLDFPTWEFGNQIAWRGDEFEEEYNTKISNAKPGWQIAYTVRPGERLAIGTFPPREYDWKASFDLNYSNVYPSSRTLNSLQNWKDQWDIGTIITWSFNAQTVGMQFGRHYIYSYYEDLMKGMVNAAKEAGMKALTYTSGYFYYNRWDPMEYITEVTRLRDHYGLDGVYLDGLPSEASWLVAYEEARMLRELFPDGNLIVHQTGQPGNGGPPLSSPSFFLPMIDTYLSHTLKGENVGMYGLDHALFPTWTQYNMANCIGVQKGDYWRIDENSTAMIPQIDQDLMFLVRNGRARLTDQQLWPEVYLPILHKLEDEWEKNGDKEHFYEEYFAPLARELVHPYLEKYGDIYTVDESFDSAANLIDYSINNVKAQVVKDGENSVLRVQGERNHNQGSIFKRCISLNGPVNVEYDIKVNELGRIEQLVSDSHSTPGVGLLFDKDLKIKLKDSRGGYTIIGKYQKGQWQKVKLELNTDTHSFNVIINGEKLISNIALDKEFYYITDYEFFGGGYGSSFDIDNIKISYHY